MKWKWTSGRMFVWTVCGKHFSRSSRNSPAFMHSECWCGFILIIICRHRQWVGFVNSRIGQHGSHQFNRRQQIYVRHWSNVVSEWIYECGFRGEYSHISSSVHVPLSPIRCCENPISIHGRNLISIYCKFPQMNQHRIKDVFLIPNAGHFGWNWKLVLRNCVASCSCCSPSIDASSVSGTRQHQNPICITRKE